jgi:hypothetical protein
MKNDYAILRLDMREEITAYQFASMLGYIDGIYGSFLYLDYAKNLPRGRVMPSHINPDKEEELYLKRVDIGTPNYIELVGIAEHLYNSIIFLKEHWSDISSVTKTVGELVSGAGTVVGVIDLIKSLKGEMKKDDSLEGFKNLENRVSDIEHILNDMKESGKIDNASYEYKANYFQYAKTGSRDIITNVSFTLIANR